MAFTPRLNDIGMLNNFHWYSQNPFYIAGYGLPNCTTYAWGRFWEISDPLGTGENRPTLPTSNGGDWWGDVDTSVYEIGQTPKLGAVICFSDDYAGGDGHVAIVEEINQDGTITCSNSAWGGSYFYLTTLSSSNDYKYSHFTKQGFIYNPFVSPTPPPPVHSARPKRFPWILYARKLRDNII